MIPYFHRSFSDQPSARYADGMETLAYGKLWTLKNNGKNLEYVECSVYMYIYTIICHLSFYPPLCSKIVLGHLPMTQCFSVFFILRVHARPGGPASRQRTLNNLPGCGHSLGILVCYRADKVLCWGCYQDTGHFSEKYFFHHACASCPIHKMRGVCPDFLLSLTS